MDAIASAGLDVAAAPDPSTSRPGATGDPGREPTPAETRWLALGTLAHLVVTDAALLGTARASVEATLRDVDATYSRFRTDSELCRIAARAGRPVHVSALLAWAMEVALRAAEQTGGAVDPTVGRSLRVLGYDRDFDRVARATGPIEIRVEPAPGWRSVWLDRSSRRLRVPVGVELDLGSTGKALAADLAAAAARRAMGRGGVLLSLGGDIAAAGEVPTGGWRILVAEDSSLPSDGPGEVVAVGRDAVATSSTTVRRWRRGHDVLHHLIDPATGRPADGPWRTATVVAGTSVDANTAATAAIVLGERGRDWLTGTGLAARLVSRQGEVVRLNGWPQAMGTAV